MSTTALVPTNGAAATELAHQLGAELTATALTISDPDLPYSDWENIGRAISFVGNAWQWWVGDWITVGETLYGEEAAQAVDDRASRYDLARRVTGKEQGYLQNIASVCRRIARERRRPELDFTHHSEVSSLDPDEQTFWLQQAIDNQWSKAELRQAIRDAKNPPAPEPDPENPEPPAAAGTGDGLTIAERIEKAARNVWGQAQAMTNGGWHVPDEAMEQLVTALGE